MPQATSQRLAQRSLTDEVGITQGSKVYARPVDTYIAPAVDPDVAGLANGLRAFLPAVAQLQEVNERAEADRQKRIADTEAQSQKHQDQQEEAQGMAKRQAGGFEISDAAPPEFATDAFRNGYLNQHAAMMGQHASDDMLKAYQDGKNTQGFNPEQLMSNFLAKDVAGLRSPEQIKHFIAASERTKNSIRDDWAQTQYQTLKDKTVQMLQAEAGSIILGGMEPEEHRESYDNWLDKARSLNMTRAEASKMYLDNLTQAAADGNPDIVAMAGHKGRDGFSFMDDPASAERVNAAYERGMAVRQQRLDKLNVVDNGKEIINFENTLRDPEQVMKLNMPWLVARTGEGKMFRSDTEMAQAYEKIVVAQESANHVQAVRRLPDGMLSAYANDPDVKKEIESRGNALFDQIDPANPESFNTAVPQLLAFQLESGVPNPRLKSLLSNSINMARDLKAEAPPQAFQKAYSTWVAIKDSANSQVLPDLVPTEQGRLFYETYHSLLKSGSGANVAWQDAARLLDEKNVEHAKKILTPETRKVIAETLNKEFQGEGFWTGALMLGSGSYGSRVKARNAHIPRMAVEEAVERSVRMGASVDVAIQAATADAQARYTLLPNGMWMENMRGESKDTLAAATVGLLSEVHQSRIAAGEIKADVKQDYTPVLSADQKFYYIRDSLGAIHGTFTAQDAKNSYIKYKFDAESERMQAKRDSRVAGIERDGEGNIVIPTDSNPYRNMATEARSLKAAPFPVPKSTVAPAHPVGNPTAVLSVTPGKKAKPEPFTPPTTNLKNALEATLEVRQGRPAPPPIVQASAPKGPPPIVQSTPPIVKAAPTPPPVSKEAKLNAFTDTEFLKNWEGLVQLHATRAISDAKFLEFKKHKQEILDRQAEGALEVLNDVRANLPAGGDVFKDGTPIHKVERGRIEIPLSVDPKAQTGLGIAKQNVHSDPSYALTAIMEQGMDKVPLKAFNDQARGRNVGLGIQVFKDHPPTTEMLKRAGVDPKNVNKVIDGKLALNPDQLHRIFRISQAKHQAVARDVLGVAKDGTPYYDLAPPNVKAVIDDMAYVSGLNPKAFGTERFKKMLTQFREGDYASVTKNLPLYWRKGKKGPLQDNQRRVTAWRIMLQGTKAFEAYLNEH